MSRQPAATTLLLAGVLVLTAWAGTAGAAPPPDDDDFVFRPVDDAPDPPTARPAPAPPARPAAEPVTDQDRADADRLDQLLREGRTGEALVQCERSIIRHTARKAPLPRGLAQRCARAHVAQGDKLFSLKAVAEARREWRAAVGLDPTLIDDPAYVKRLTLEDRASGGLLPPLRPLPAPVVRPATPVRPSPAPVQPLPARPAPADDHDLERLDEFEDGASPAPPPTTPLRPAAPSPTPDDDDGFVAVPELERPSPRPGARPAPVDPFSQPLPGGSPPPSATQPRRVTNAPDRSRPRWGAPPAGEPDTPDEAAPAGDGPGVAEELDGDEEEEEEEEEPEEPPGPRAGRHLGLGLGFGFDGLMSVVVGWMYDELVAVEAAVGVIFPTLDSRIRIYGFRFPVTPVVGLGMLTPFGDKDYYGANIGYFPDLYTHGASIHLDIGVSWAPIEQVDVYAGVAFLTTLDFDDLDQLVMFPMWSIQALWYF